MIFLHTELSQVVNKLHPWTNLQKSKIILIRHNILYNTPNRYLLLEQQQQYLGRWTDTIEQTQRGSVRLSGAEGLVLMLFLSERQPSPETHLETLPKQQSSQTQQEGLKYHTIGVITNTEHPWNQSEHPKTNSNILKATSSHNNVINTKTRQIRRTSERAVSQHLNNLQKTNNKTFPYFYWTHATC